MAEARRVQYRVVFDVLNATYGRPQWRSHGPPLDELVATILSQATADVNTARAFASLRARFPEWEQVMLAPIPEVVDAIHSAGLANVKGPRIQDALRHIFAERGDLSLDFLADLPLDEAMDWLTRIEGVGPKTASVVLLFALGRPVFPVDTHVHRVSGRLGLIPPRAGADKAHVILAELGAPETYYPMHMNLIRHGREVCRARHPQCFRCPLQAHCDYFHTVVLGAADA